MSRKNLTPINVYVTREEKKLIKENAEKHSLSSSAFLREVGLGFTVTPTLDQQAISDLAKLNADQGRLGGLLKLWLTNDEKLALYDEQKLTSAIEEMLKKIYSIQETLYDKVSKL